MANSDNPHGFTLATKPLRLTSYAKNTGAAIYAGDMLQINTTSGLLRVAVAGGTSLVGVAVSYRAAADTEVLVSDHPDQLYYCQDDGASGTLAATNVGNNLDIVVTAGNATLLKSQHELDTDSVVAKKAQMRILGKHSADTWGKNVRVLCVINEGLYTISKTGV